MAISLASLKRAGSTITPPTMLFYGVPGIGKTNIAAGAPSPVFIQTEDGMRNRRLADVPSFGLLTTYGEVVEAIGSLVTEQHEFKTAIFDSLDWLEPLIWKETCDRNGWANIEAADYGKGYTAALDVWREFLDGCNAIRYSAGMTTIFLAHHVVTKFKAPDTEPYDRYDIKLHESNKGLGARPLMKEHAEFILFMNYRVSIVKDGTAAQKKKGDGTARGVGGGNRVVYTEERPSHIAKSRDDMPDTIQLPDLKPEDGASVLWDAVAQHIPYFQAAA